MNYDQIINILNNHKEVTITVFGDFSLDKYLYIDGGRDELSLETGLVAYQVTDKKIHAGAAGTIVNNLLALGARVYCVGIVGKDGEGFELLKILEESGANTDYMIRTDVRSTGTYIKPMRYENNQRKEMNRIDIKNFTRTPMDLQEKLIGNLGELLSISDGIIISGQYLEEDCAAITEFIQNRISQLAVEYNNIIWYADSRKNIGRFRNIILKCNHKELGEVFNIDESKIDPDLALKYAKKLYERKNPAVYITLGERGSVLYDGREYKIPAFPVEGEIDIVGAGDASNAAIVFALSKGANSHQAGYVGNAASSIVIRKIGETGTASLEELTSLLDNIEY